MALSRCKTHSPPKPGNKNYVISVNLLGYPHTSTICGRKNCNDPGLIWLTKQEHQDYNAGFRVFAYDSNVAKVQVI